MNPPGYLPPDGICAVGDQELLARAAHYLDASESAATRRAHASDWRDWERWCAARGCVAHPALPAALALYLVDLAERGMRPSTLARRVATLSRAHGALEVNPARSREVRQVLAGIARERGVAARAARALLLEDVRQVAHYCANRGGRAGLRDQVLLLVGWCCALRESEIVSVRLGDLARVDRGYELTLRRSKVDQVGAGCTLAIPRARLAGSSCPVSALDAWLRELRDAGASDGAPLFPRLRRDGTWHLEEPLVPRRVALIVARRCREACLGDGWSGHSLRAGFATSAARAGVPDRAIMRTTRHRSRTTLDRYVRAGELWSECAAAELL